MAGCWGVLCAAGTSPAQAATSPASDKKDSFRARNVKEISEYESSEANDALVSDYVPLRRKTYGTVTPYVVEERIAQIHTTVDDSSGGDEDLSFALL